MLQEAQICGVPLLFVLDHFSAFCHQSKQTLLYTLLDLCSSPDVKLCVIGIDRDCTITERLEKRIQSRCAWSVRLIQDFRKGKLW